MTQPETPGSQIVKNVLVLDGGGVRGLSSLLILKALMRNINAAIREQIPDEDDLKPYQIFDLVTGTSTGGLIAIMIGKLGMTLEKCIQAYYDLSRIAFGKKQLIRILARGFTRREWSKYSSKNLENCINAMVWERSDKRQTPMVFTDESRDSTACAVVCRECISGHRRACKPGAVLICSLACPETINNCLVSEAARATSAAPTYFTPQTIDKRRFVDGAIGFNNPSFETYYHYTQRERAARSAGRPLVAGARPPDDYHGGIDWSMLRLVNLGTGNKSDAEQPHQRDGRRYRERLGKWFTELQEIAFDTHDVVTWMETLASKDDNLTYERFSAGNELSNIKMDDHKALSEIQTLTEAYLGERETQENLEKVAQKIASDYLQRSEDLNRSVIGTVPVVAVRPASPPEAIPAVDTTPLANTTPPTNMTPASNASTASSMMPAVGTPTKNDETPAVGTHSSTALPDLVHSSGRKTHSPASTTIGTTPRTPTSSSPLMKIARNLYQKLMKSPFQSKSKNLSIGNNERAPTQTVLMDPSASPEPRETEEAVSFPDAPRDWFLMSREERDTLRRAEVLRRTLSG